MRSKAERQAEFERRELLRKAKLAEGRERYRASMAQIDERNSAQKVERAEAIELANQTVRYPMPPSLFESITGRGWLRYPREVRRYNEAYRAQQDQIAAGEDIPVTSRLPPFTQTSRDTSVEATGTDLDPDDLPDDDPDVVAGMKRLAELPAAESQIQDVAFRGVRSPDQFG